MSAVQSEQRPVRLAHVVSHPIQYFAPLYRELAARPQIELTVFFRSDATIGEYHDPEFDQTIAWNIPLLDGYSYKFCRSAVGAKIPTRLVQRPNFDIAAEIGSQRYDVVWAHGYAHAATWLSFLAGRARGARLLLRDEQTLLGHRPWYKRALKETLLRGLFSGTAALYIGEQNRRYLEHYGIRPGHLFPARYCVDNEFFQRQAQELSPLRRELREQFGVRDDAPVVLFCGKLIERKQPLVLLEAFDAARKEYPCWLLIVGDGPVRAAVERRIRARRMDNVLIAGFLDQRKIATAYAAADIFVLPSTYETWGLVVNEAMNFSLPIIVTDKVGCAEDLVRPGWNGFIVPSARADQLADAISVLIADEGARRTFGDQSRTIVATYSIEACADGIVAACLALARENRKERAGH